jgi:Leucine-rich repeat (LRR) protein
LGLISENGEFVMKNKGYQTIPKAFYTNKFHDILILDIRGNLINEIPSEVCLNMPSLIKMDVRNNAIKQIPILIAELAQLSILRVDHNKLFSLPEQIGQLVELEDLTLSDNVLKELP